MRKKYKSTLRARHASQVKTKKEVKMPHATARFCVDNLPNRPKKAKEYVRRRVRKWILENLREV